MWYIVAAEGCLIVGALGLLSSFIWDLLHKHEADADERDRLDFRKQINAYIALLAHDNMPITPSDRYVLQDLINYYREQFC